MGVPIAITLGIANFVTLGFFTDIDLMVLVQRMYAALDSFSLLCIPFFMIAGELMQRGGISKRLINLGKAIVGHLPGGFAMVCVVASMFFAAMSGSGPATTAAIGSILIPAMVNAGYDKQFSSSLQAIAGALGPIIPPSILFVTYGVVTDTSIGALFIAGIVPGLMIGIVLMLVVYIFSLRRGYKGTEQFSFKELWVSFKDSIFALLVPVIILGGIYGGIFTPTEAAAAASIYALFIGVFVYKELNLNEIKDSLLKAGITSGMVMFIVSNSYGFTWILTREHIPNAIANFLINAIPNEFLLLLAINVLLLITGCFIELVSAILILAPILLPVVTQIGLDPIHFGALMVVNLSLGLVTPPMGINLFVASGITEGITIEEVAKGVIPFLLTLLALQVLITYIPWFTMVLPRLLGY